MKRNMINLILKHKKTDLVKLMIPDNPSFPYLEKAGLLSGMCIEDDLLHWNPEKAQVTNGLILELESFVGKFKWSILTNKICDVVGIHPDHNKSQVQRIRLLIKRTKEIIGVYSIKDDPWVFLKKLCEGGEMFKECLIMSKTQIQIEEIGEQISEDIAHMKFSNCWHCGISAEESNLFMCKGCLVAVYCGNECINLDWKADHKRMCKNVRLAKYGDTLLSPPNDSDDEVSQDTLKGKYRRALRHIKEQENVIKVKMEEAIEMQSQLGELKDSAQKLRQVQREKAGKSSALERMRKQKETGDLEEDIDDLENPRNKMQQTRIKGLTNEEALVIKTNEITFGSGHLEAFGGRYIKEDGHHYGESIFVKLPSSREILNNENVDKKTLQKRSLRVKDFMTLSSGMAGKTMEEDTDSLKKLFAVLIEQNKTIVINTLKQPQDLESFEETIPRASNTVYDDNEHAI